MSQFLFLLKRSIGNTLISFFIPTFKVFHHNLFRFSFLICVKMKYILNVFFKQGFSYGNCKLSKNFASLIFFFLKNIIISFRLLKKKSKTEHR